MSIHEEIHQCTFCVFLLLTHSSRQHGAPGASAMARRYFRRSRVKLLVKFVVVLADEDAVVLLELVPPWPPLPADVLGLNCPVEEPGAHWLTT